MKKHRKIKILAISSAYWITLSLGLRSEACGTKRSVPNPEPPPLSVSLYIPDHLRQAFVRGLNFDIILFSNPVIENYRVMHKEDLMRMILQRQRCRDWGPVDLVQIEELDGR